MTFRWDEEDVEEFMEQNIAQIGQLIVVGRQLDIGCGIIDLLAYDADTQELIVVEVKKEIIEEAAIGQLLRYMMGVENGLKELGDAVDLPITGIRGILAADRISKQAALAIQYFQGRVQFCEVGLNVEGYLLMHDINNRQHTYNTEALQTSICEAKEMQRIAQPEVSEQ